jgi:CRP-like cAMP-binding protein
MLRIARRLHFCLLPMRLRQRLIFGVVSHRRYWRAMQIGLQRERLSRGRNRRDAEGERNQTDGLHRRTLNSFVISMGAAR